MYTQKMHPAATFPEVSVTLSTGETVSLTNKEEGCDWKMVVVFRGKHCPICTKYLNKLEDFTGRLREVNIDVVAVSGDSKAQLDEHLDELSINFPIACGLSQSDMKKLGLYISEPRSEKETDHNFAEPALFVLNSDNEIHIAEIANAPFVRPDLEQLVSGLEFIRNPDNNYPIRGTLKS
ncbi:redoxin domain-containing protein [Alteromonas mediterranea]|jgi:peroxiredoxin|uniref:redoxin domain-containing protein n=1 Tax=Alteromonas mediterranea TaxID=314275 RepID=UPI000E8880FB|nr:redoxin domain-containing protein [Alteromonas mediterranea]HBL22056.1 thioredoxin peroxidase [Alteromonas mediterranea]|tara:strand:+ start:138 stop:674 length:537 start_codon:yes stop_codon:yes gene_type:complete